MSIDEFLALENDNASAGEHVPDVSDVCAVRLMLCQKRLPVELVAIMVMAFAEYEPRRGLKALHDPLHWENRDELVQYLGYCWQLIVRCDMVAKALGLEVFWEDMIARRIVELYGSWGQRSYWDGEKDEERCRLRQWWKDQDYRCLD